MQLGGLGQRGSRRRRRRGSSAEGATPSPGYGPRGQGPSKNRQGSGKNTWTVYVKKIEKGQRATLCCVPWRLEQTAESHSLLSRLSRA